VDGYAASEIGSQFIKPFPCHLLRFLKIALAGGRNHIALRALDLVACRPGPRAIAGALIQRHSTIEDFDRVGRLSKLTSASIRSAGRVGRTAHAKNGQRGQRPRSASY